MKKRMLSIFAVLAMWLMLLPTAAFADTAPDILYIDIANKVSDISTVDKLELTLGYDDGYDIKQATHLSGSIFMCDISETAASVNSIQMQLYIIGDTDRGIGSITSFRDGYNLFKVSFAGSTSPGSWGVCHAHCACGATHTQIGDHTDSDIRIYTAWNETHRLPTDAGYYYLTEDVELYGWWTPVDGTVLCLNGHNVSIDGNNPTLYLQGADKVFTLTDCQTGDKQGKITHNSGKKGVGIYNYGSNFNMFGGIITANNNENGAGVYNVPEGYYFSTFKMYGGTISGNTASVNGGGVYNDGHFYFYGGSITQNSADVGGGIYNTNQYNKVSDITMSGGSITKNSAIIGGGVYNDTNTSLKMLGGQITDNTISKSSDSGRTPHGGGVYQNGEMTVGGAAKISGNSLKEGSTLTDSNLFLQSNKAIKLDTEKPLATGAELKISAKDANQTVIADFSDSSSLKYMSTDSSLYELTAKEGKLLYTVRPSYVVVDGVEIVDSDDDVLDDGGSVKYDRVTSTLTLKNAKLTKRFGFDTNINAGIYTSNPQLTLVLDGKNTLTLSGDEGAYINAAILAEDLKITGNGSLTIKTGAANTNTMGLFSDNLEIDDGVTLTVTTDEAKGVDTRGGTYGIYSDNITVGAAKVTVTSGKATGSEYAESYGIYAREDFEIDDAAELKVTAGNAVVADSGRAVSCGVYVFGTVTVGNATLNVQGGTADALGDNKAYSYGIYAIGGMTVEDGANISASAKKTTSEDVAESSGIFVVNGLEIFNAKVIGAGGAASGADDSRSSGILSYEDITIHENAVVSGTGGDVTVADGQAKSYGICAYEDLNIKDDVKLTAKSGKAVGIELAYSKAIYAGGDCIICDGVNVTATANTAVTKDKGDESVLGSAISHGIHVGNDFSMHAAEVNLRSGTAAALNQGSDYATGSSHAAGDGAYVGGNLIIKEGAKVTANGGTATYVDPNNNKNTGKRLDAYSGGIYVKGEAMLSGTLVAKGGNVYSTYETHEADEYAGGEAIGYGLMAEGDVLVFEGANIKLTGGNAKVNGTEYGTAYSNGLNVLNGNIDISGGALYAVSGTANGGTNAHTAAIELYSDNSGKGTLAVSGGWLKAESDNSAILASNDIVISDPAAITTPEGGSIVVESKYDNSRKTVSDAEGVVADTVVIWDGTTAQFKAPATSYSGGHSGSSSKADTTTTVTKPENTPEATTPDSTESNTAQGGFTDVKSSDYFAEAVEWAVAEDITGGVSANTFAPNDSCTRAQIVTFLWRASGKPTVDYAENFADVDEGAYYAEAISWAAGKEIVNGYGDDSFAPNDSITREQMAAILYRFAKAEGMDTTQGGMAVREFADYESISEYAIAAMQWAVNAGIMNGSDGSLLPQAACTRAQSVTMLYRLLGK